MPIPPTMRADLLELLSGGAAHLVFDAAIENLPADLRGQKPKQLPHTPWQLLEHLRLAQHDILDFCRNKNYKPLPWPERYWPETDAPPSDWAWEESVLAFQTDLSEMLYLVADKSTDLLALIPWGADQTIFREAMLVADHNSYHLGQLVTVRRMLGAWGQ